MDAILFRYRARDLTAGDIAHIQAVIASHYARGRSFIAQTLCERWDWRQLNGGYKEFAARDLLLRLEEAGLIELPPRQRVKSNVSKQSYAQIPLYTQQPLSGPVGDYPGPVIEAAQGAHSELWDYLLHHYHYLGHPKLVGEHLKQVVFIDGQVVGCLGWASAAWKIAARDRHIGWTVSLKRTRLHLIINNVRFLILPWVRVPHLASKVLALSVRGWLAAGKSAMATAWSWPRPLWTCRALRAPVTEPPIGSAWARPRGMPNGAMHIIATAWSKASICIPSIGIGRRHSPER